MIRFLWFLLLGFLFFKLFQYLRESFSHSSPRTSQKQPGKGEKMVKDPQCGTYVPQSEALSATRSGETYYFCSSECRDKFLSK